MQRDIRQGQRIQVNASWSSFRGQHGTISEVRNGLCPSRGPVVMILLDGESKPMAFEPSAFCVIVGPASEPNMTGAE